MSFDYDVVVLGLGGIGSFVADQLALGGYKVLGLEQFDPVHDLGSSHGETRAIRKAYFEHPFYVPLILRAYELWEDLIKFSNEELMVKSGCLILGPKGSPVIESCLQSAKKFNIQHKHIFHNELSTTFDLKIKPGFQGFYEPEGGYLFIEKCIYQAQKRAIKNGAQLEFQAQLQTVREMRDGYEVVWQSKVVTAKKVICALGAWSMEFLNSMGSNQLTMSPKRVVQFWFEASGYSELPVYFQDTQSGPWIYGFPPLSNRIKVAFHNIFSDCHPNSVDRNISNSEVEQMVGEINELLPQIGPFITAKTCMYNLTPDEHFYLGPLPQFGAGFYLASGFSGHGFKFAPVIGEVARRWVEGENKFDLSFLSPERKFK